MYYIYHIPTFIHKDGMNGKIGVSVEPERRVNNQGYTDYEILEEFTCIYLVSYREIALQKEYGYKVDTTMYYQSKAWKQKGCVNGGKKQGPIQGKHNVESGHLDNIRKLALTKEARKKAVENTDYKSIAIKNSTVIYQYDLNKNLIQKYNSVKEATDILFIPGSTIVNNAKKRTKTCHGFIFSYELISATTECSSSICASI